MSRQPASLALSERMAERLCAALNSLLDCDARYHAHEIPQADPLPPLLTWRVDVRDDARDDLARMFCEGYFAALADGPF